MIAPYYSQIFQPITLVSYFIVAAWVWPLAAAMLLAQFSSDDGQDRYQQQSVSDVAISILATVIAAAWFLVPLLSAVLFAGTVIWLVLRYGYNVLHRIIRGVWIVRRVPSPRGDAVRVSISVGLFVTLLAILSGGVMAVQYVVAHRWWLGLFVVVAAVGLAKLGLRAWEQVECWWVCPPAENASNWTRDLVPSGWSRVNQYKGIFVEVTAFQNSALPNELLFSLSTSRGHELEILSGVTRKYTDRWR